MKTYLGSPKAFIFKSRDLFSSVGLSVLASDWKYVVETFLAPAVSTKLRLEICGSNHIYVVNYVVSLLTGIAYFL